MTRDFSSGTPGTARFHGTGALLLASSGLAAAFGAASCCALPVLLASLGMSSGWLLAVAWFAAPHRAALLTVAITCLAGSGGLLIWRRRSIACAFNGGCARPATTVASATVALSLAAILAVLSFVFA